MIKEICSWLTRWLDGQTGRSQEHISSMTGSSPDKTAIKRM